MLAELLKTRPDLLTQLDGWFQRRPDRLGVYLMVLVAGRKLGLVQNPVRLSLDWFYGVLLGFTGFYWVLPSFLSFTGFVLGFKRFSGEWSRLNWFLHKSLDSSVTRGVLLGFTGFYWVLLGLFLPSNESFMRLHSDTNSLAAPFFSGLYLFFFTFFSFSFFFILHRIPFFLLFFFGNLFSKVHFRKEEEESTTLMLRSLQNEEKNFIFKKKKSKRKTKKNSNEKKRKRKKFQQNETVRLKYFNKMAPCYCRTQLQWRQIGFGIPRRLYLVLLGFLRYYLVFRGFTGFYLVLYDFTGLYLFFLRVLLGFT